jgi:hypothetical protein
MLIVVGNIHATEISTIFKEIKKVKRRKLKAIFPQRKITLNIFFMFPLGSFFVELNLVWTFLPLQKSPIFPRQVFNKIFAKARLQHYMFSGFLHAVYL